MFGFVSTPILTDGIGSLLELPENRTNYDKLSDFIAKGQRRTFVLIQLPVLIYLISFAMYKFRHIIRKTQPN
jgi:hypothetical protein